MRFDGTIVLRTMLDHPALFPIQKEADDLARKVIVARVKASTQIEQLKAICTALGPDQFKLVIDGIADRDAAGVLGKIDKENKEAKTAGGPAQRILLIELATGAIEPRIKEIKERAKPAKAKPEAGQRAPKSAAGKAINSKSTTAQRRPRST